MAAKGDFQMSIGLLVTVIFAVVLLTLGIALIRDWLFGITKLGQQMQEQAEKQLKDQLSKTGDTFLISPTEHKENPKTEISVTAGIKNTDPDDHQYVIGISTEKVPIGVTRADVSSWIQYLDTAKTIKAGDVNFVSIYMTIPSNAKKGIYFFRISSCFNKEGILPIAAACNANSDNLWATSQDFTLTVK